MNIHSFLLKIKQSTCKHEFAIEDLQKSNIPLPEGITIEETYSHPGHTERVMWPCAKCGKVFKAHCGLDIAPTHGFIFRRSNR